ncbi:hypothetical protein [Poritiphilus flavus]|uniref:Extracellular endo-alpha-(1->5)-L-arabinanase C-terminal domain-containing protein n=1 Tax=Poritiphilus flavus TaxID=2697053 RepID=A0A6L9EEJ7_9FLAO|nr:hypothetical protein [Poritiphilus flavus]NAS13165.1 hypothetical protein [Poritiphilus flavus]
MKKLIFFPILILAILNTSCSEDEIDSSLAGNWSGTYTGDDRGAWTVNVNSSGVVTGVATSSRNSETYAINGTVAENGMLSATLGTTTEGGEFVGQLREDNEAIGTWSNAGANASGSWNGERQ